MVFLEDAMKTIKSFIFLLIAGVILLGLSFQAHAIPDLQIYIPGATYDTSTETWIINSYDYELWVIGSNVDINDVKFAAAVPTNEEGTIDVTWTQGILNETGLVSKVPGYNDSLSETATYASDQGISFTEYGTPTMGNGKSLPGHSVFPSSYYEYWIGDFGLTDTVHNYIPGDEWSDEASGEIKKFDIHVSGYTWVDIAAYDHYIHSKNGAKSVFTPFSHDGGAIPEPSTILLVGAGLLGIWIFRQKRTEV
jgi:hypothetical protein